MSDVIKTKGIFTSKDDNGNVYELYPETPMDMVPGLEDTLGYMKKNLLKNTATTQTISDVTFTVNEDSSITVNGTNTNSEYAAKLIINPSVTLPTGEYIVSGGVDGGDASTYRLIFVDETGNCIFYLNDSNEKKFIAQNDITISVRIDVAKGATAENLTFYPMIRDARITDDAYEPYVDDIYSQLNALRNDVNLNSQSIESTEKKVDDLTATTNNMSTDVEGLKTDVRELQSKKIELDTTLSKAGTAADAKAVGDAIDGLQNVQVNYGVMYREMVAIPSDNSSLTLCGITYSDGKFVAVGSNGVIVYSEDGITWTAVTNTNTTENMKSITYGGNKFVAVGSNGVIVYSEDGITWTAASSPVSNTIYKVTYGDGKFVAAAESGYVIYSEDGITWTTVIANSKGGYLNGITYGGNKFVAVGSGGVIDYSEDGIKWTEATDPTSVTLRSVVYGDGKFVAVGNDNVIIYSEDGITWTAASSPVSGTGDFTAVTYGDGMFVATGAGDVIYSIDGIKWALSYDTNEILYDLIYVNGEFVVLNSRKIYYFERKLVKQTTESFAEYSCFENNYLLSEMAKISTNVTLKSKLTSGKTDASGNLVTTFIPNNVTIISAYRYDAAGMVVPFINADGYWSFRVHAVSTSVAIVKNTSMTIKFFYYNYKV